MDIRIGNGFDVHRFAEGRELWLCGIKIDHHTGLLGHSDADVAIHALCDAMLGALALRDIGYHFPDTDPAYAGADSAKLLAEVASMISEKGYSVSNADITIIAQKPKLLPYIPQMAVRLAEILNLPPNRISVKATTTEKLGFTGREEGIAAMASCLLLSV